MAMPDDIGNVLGQSIAALHLTNASIFTRLFDLLVKKELVVRDELVEMMEAVVADQPEEYSRKAYAETLLTLTREERGE